MGMDKNVRKDNRTKLRDTRTLTGLSQEKERTRTLRRIINEKGGTLEKYVVRKVKRKMIQMH